MEDLVQIVVSFFSDPITWKFFVLAAVPVFAYGLFFYKKAPRPRSKKIFLITFLIGCLSVVPLLLYQYLYLNYFPQLETQLLLKNVPLYGLVAYTVNILFISILIFTITFICTVTVTFFSKYTFKNVWRSVMQENFNFYFIAFLLGGLIFIEALIGAKWGVYFLQTTLGVIVMRAMMEEYSKHLIVRFTDDDELFNIDDAIELSLFVGLAFAFVENVIYFTNISENVIALFVGRSLLTVLAHITFSGIFGYYYGLAHFASPLYFEKHTVGGKKSLFLKMVSKVLFLKQSNLFREIMILKGLLLSTIVHTLFNLLLSLNLLPMAFLVVLGGAYLLLMLLKQKENYRQLGMIGTGVMPTNDFKNLTWKIESLRWAKEIRAERLRKEIEALQREDN